MAANLGDDLRQFDNTLGEVMRGKKKGVVQLRDLAYFKRIHNKIENYPLLKELFKDKKAR